LALSPSNTHTPAYYLSVEPIKIAILDLYDGHPNQGMRGIKQIVEDQVFPNEWKVFDVRGKNELPGPEYDVYISTGGPGSPLTEQEEWYQRWCALMDTLWEHNKKQGVSKKYVFLICHSFQMIVNHWKLGEITQRKSTAFGIFPMHKTEAGDEEAVLVSLPEPFYAVDSRDWQVVQPDMKAMEKLGAKLLCIEKDRPHVPYERATMGIRFSNEFIGFQFHPEADDFGMNLYFHRADKKKQVIETHGEKKYLEMLDYLKDKNKIQRTQSTILPGFLQLAMMKLRNFSF
jgi:homoserine O-succinyltransferase/O-acetyltransferase